MADLEEAREAQEFMLENMELMQKTVELNAVLMKIAFDSLKKAGFSDDQANAFIIARGPTLG